MTDSETDTHKTEAELRISRVKALSNADLLGVATRLDESRISALSELVEGRGGPAPRPTTRHDANP